MAQEAKTKRVYARVAPKALEVVQRAAELQGRSVSDFMVAAAQEAAHRAIEESQVIRLSVADQKAFAEALLNPPAPNEALRKAARLHAENVEVR
jgi:uncharacterized protein (DUF1778 family)